MRPSGTAPDIPCMVVCNPLNAGAEGLPQPCHHMACSLQPRRRSRLRRTPSATMPETATKGNSRSTRLPAETEPTLCAAGENFWCNPYLRRAADWAIFSHKGRANTATAIDSSEKVAARRACSKKSIADMQSIFEPRVGS